MLALKGHGRLIERLRSIDQAGARPGHLQNMRFKAELGTWLASRVRSDARRRQSRSSLSNCSDFDIAHRLESSMRESRTVWHLLSVAYATQNANYTVTAAGPT